MKLIAIYKEPITGNGRLLPRDIRNYLGAITHDDEELNKIVMWHERKQPSIIYTMPNRKSFAILSFLPETEAKKYFIKIKNAIERNPNISIGGVCVQVGEVFTTDYEYTNFSNGFFEREFRTPFILGVSKQDYAIARELSKDEKIDMPRLEKMMSDTIKESILFQQRDWFGEEIFNTDDLMLIYKDIKYLSVEYKKGEWYPAVRATVISNKLLPHFLGYKIGLGYGELATQKEMQRRGK
jgi:hypothetical protein